MFTCKIRFEKIKYFKILLNKVTLFLSDKNIAEFVILGSRWTVHSSHFNAK